MEKIISFVKKIIPAKLFKLIQPTYHYLMSFIGAVIYRFPSRGIKVVGVTGTKGKSSVTEILARVFSESGYKVASLGTVCFRVGNEIRPNLFKMTMPGRFFVQKFIRQAVDKKCDFIFIEMTSEGARQFRHKFISLDALVFTNLAKEHIESHGGYENYREAKLKIADTLSKSHKKEKFMIGNDDDVEAKLFFERAKPALSVPYSLKTASPYITSDSGIEFMFDGQTFLSGLRGKFNIYNALAVLSVAKVFNLEMEKVKKALSKISEIPGRVESIKTNFGFEIIVDYAHTPDSLKALYEAFSPENPPKILGVSGQKTNKKLICVLGNTGGGRDTWKRPEMGKIADQYCEEIILTNEDPYNEDPRKIVEEMAVVIDKKKLTIEMDRRKALRLAIEKGIGISKNKQEGCVVLVTGKGTDPYIMEANDKKTPWSDRKVVEEELKNLPY